MGFLDFFKPKQSMLSSKEAIERWKKKIKKLKKAK